MTFATDDTGHATVVVTVGGIERGQFRFNGIDGQMFDPLTTVEVDEARVRAAALSLRVFVSAEEAYECRCASHP